MKEFIINTAIISIISLSLFLAILCNANGYTDAYYIRFTTPKQNSLILGTSRAAQALKPQVFKQFLNLDIYNYAFTGTISPYGPVYFESIKKKLNPNKNKNGIFIVTVDTWGISSNIKHPNKVNQFREKELCLGNTQIVDVKPNFQYLFNNLSGEFAKIITNFKRNVFLHENGWLEVSVKMDSLKVNRRIKSKLKTLSEVTPKLKYSKVRVKYLIKTIRYLSNYGKVYLVRLPLHKNVMKFEKELINDFDIKIKDAIDYSDGYLDMTPLNDSFDYVDGHHLYKSSGERVSKIIAKWIAEKRK